VYIPGNLEKARDMLDTIMSYSNHLGLFSEQISARGQAIGNYPQAFTHLSLISACYNLDKAMNMENGIDNELSFNMDEDVIV
jgi:GH15 family glucan-1,4-alpha-glucosidase